MERKNRAFAFGVFNSNRHSDDSYLVFRVIVPREPRTEAMCKVTDAEREWNEQKLREIAETPHLPDCFWKTPNRLVVPQGFKVSLEDEELEIDPCKRSQHPFAALARLQLGPLTDSALCDRIKRGRALLEWQAKPRKRDQTHDLEYQNNRELDELKGKKAAASQADNLTTVVRSDKLGIRFGRIRPCVISIDNPDDNTFSAIHVEHRSDPLSQGCRGLIGELTLLFMPYHDVFSAQPSKSGT